MYAITIKQNINTAMLWLCEKKHAYQKPFMLNSKPPGLYTLAIKFIFPSKRIQITGKEVILIVTVCFVFFPFLNNIPDLLGLVPSVLNI